MARRLRASTVGVTLIQAASFAAIGLALFWIFHITSAGLQARGVKTGFDFLLEPARTAVANTPFEFRPGVDSNGLALVAGAINTLKISLGAIVLATLLGVIVGLGRLSRNRLARALATLYVEGVRNVPVLIHISIWYGIALALPGPRQASLLGGVLLATNRGIHLTLFEPDPLWGTSASLAFAVLVSVVVLHRLAPQRWRPSWSIALVALVVAACIPWLLAQRLPVPDVPHVRGLRVQGGVAVTPEFAAFVVALSVYTAAFVGEIVRASVLAVPRGQWEAADALALPPSSTMTSVVFPQAVRVAIPALGNEYIGVLKNSSLAVVIGYQEVVGVGNTVLFDTGQAVEVMAVLAAFFVFVSLVLSAVVNLLNARTSLTEARV
ncbi:MAG: ABC transporter permease subunit [Burkholderiaceae bacterium]